VPQLLDPTELLDRIRRDATRAVLRGRNGLRHISGVARPPTGVSPKRTVWQRDKAQLWRYDSDQRRLGPPVVIVMSLVSRSYILDLRPGNSLVQFLLERGFDVYLVDWGVPTEADAANGLETYCDEYLPRAIAAAADASPSGDITLYGYCFGGVLSLLSLAGNPQLPVRNLAVMATPTDFTHMGPMSAMLQDGRVDPESLIDETGNVPPEVIADSFKVLKPTADVTSYVNLWQNLWNDDFVEAYQTMTQWSRDHIPFPGEAFRQTVRHLNRENALLSGRVPLGGRTAELAAITCPFLNVIADNDHIVPPPATVPLTGLVGSTDVEELHLPAGHVGLVVGRSAHRNSMPRIADWIERHSDPV
jgi:polyhydroxyalkanoate synthase